MTKSTGVGRGRPSTFNAAAAAAICDRIMDGESLRHICTDDAMPNKITVLKWLGQNAEFAAQYARAREEQAEGFADEMQAIADDPILDPADKKVRIDARKWIAAKLKPKKDGDRIEIDQTVNVRVQSIAERLDAISARPMVDVTPKPPAIAEN